MTDIETRTIAVRNPRTGATEFSFPVASSQEVAQKAARLRRNQKVWAARPVKERIGIMRRWIGAPADILDDKPADVAGPRR